MTDSLRSRLEEYETSFQTFLPRRLPVIIRVQLRNYKRLTKNLEKPFCAEFSEIMANSALFCITEIQDAIFGYYYYDQIIFVLTNNKEFDYEPYLQNNVQKIISTVSSLISVGFYRSQDLFDEKLNLVGNGIFSTNIFILPYITEVINYLIWHQHSSIRLALAAATKKELTDKYGKKTAFKLMNESSYEDKLELLSEHCNINFEDYYSSTFLKGIAIYKIPTLIPTKNGNISRNKWHLNDRIPNFLDDKDFLYNILINGVDIFRADIFDNDLI